MLRDLSIVMLIVLGTFTVASADVIMGNWQGSFSTYSGEGGVIRAQVISLGKGEYRVLFYVDVEGSEMGPLEISAQEKGKKAVIDSEVDLGPELGRFRINGEIDEEKMNGRFSGSDTDGTIEMFRIEKESSTLDAAPPPGALVLFDGSDLDSWQTAKGGKRPNWKVQRDGCMQVKNKGGSIVTKQKFESCRIHIEFRTPLKPEARGQSRGNSGVYVSGRYEIQILDSFGLPTNDNECGAIYKIATPSVNACLPPLEWQTYDITYTKPEFDSQGNKVSDAEITVLHNDIVIHDRVKLPKVTGGALDDDESQPGGLMLQDHGNPVEFRNIWIVPL
jgi:hypothetical protein